jgi:hypothetical protein
VTRRAHGWFIIPIAALTLPGCTTVTPPALVDAGNAQKVFIVWSSTHASIALPDAHGRHVRWGFGDERYMTTPGSAARALRAAALVPCGLVGARTSGALERVPERRLDDRGGAAGGDVRVLSFFADRDRIESLRERLEAAYARGSVSSRCLPLRRSQVGYNLWACNCNDWVARCARDLGARVSAFPILPRFGTWRLNVRRDACR